MMILIMLLLYLIVEFVNFEDFKKIKFMMINLVIFYILMSFNYSMNWQMLYGMLGLDIFSFLMILLTLWVFNMMEMVIYSNKSELMSLILLILMYSLIVCFSSLNFMLFYLFFEISLIPTFYLILGFGNQPERMNSGFYMLIYTMFASLPLFVLIFYLFDYLNSLNYLVVLNSIIMVNINELLFYLLMSLAFMIKLPLFLFHYWLPKAHVEAPVVGSMVLAGVMLKLGGYGIYRSMMMMMNLSIKNNYLYFSISMISLLNLSILCLRQNDLKLLVAYSSVVHMGIMVMGMLTFSNLGIIGGIMMMLGHGLCSSALFLGVNLVYDRMKSRNLYLMKGMMILYPSLSMFWFMFCSCNMSSPPSINLFSELLLVYVSVNWSFNIFLFLVIGLYLSACYSLYLYSYVYHGKLISMFLMSKIIKMSEYMNLLFHWIPLNLMILFFMNFF